MISLISLWTSTMATRKAVYPIYPIFEFQNFTDTYLGKWPSFNLIALAA